MKVIRVQVGTHFNERFQQRFHVKEEDIISILNKNLNEAHSNIHSNVLYFPHIGAIVPIALNIVDISNFFTKSIHYDTHNKKDFPLSKRFERKIIWYTK